VGRSRALYTLVEIGVFKGDNAVALIGLLHARGVEVRYVGFDLFENLEGFYLQHREEREIYDHPDYPYWEFKTS
jgi:hypothetical protein